MDFDAKIELRQLTDDWGPYSVSLENEDGDSALPGSQIVDSVTIKAYLGKVKPGELLDGKTDYASEIIESGTISSVLNNIYWNFQYPSSTSLNGQKMTLVFIVTTDTGGIYPFYLYYVKIM